MCKQFPHRTSPDNLALQAKIREMLVSAMHDLADEGYLISRQRKGNFVSPVLLTG